MPRKTLACHCQESSIFSCPSFEDTFSKEIQTGTCVNVIFIFIGSRHWPLFIKLTIGTCLACLCDYLGKSKQFLCKKLTDRHKSYYDRQKSVSKIWLLIGKSLDRRLRGRRKSVGKSPIGACAIGECLETGHTTYKLISDALNISRQMFSI